LIAAIAVPKMPTPQNAEGVMSVGWNHDKTGQPTLPSTHEAPYRTLGEGCIGGFFSISVANFQVNPPMHAKVSYGTVEGVLGSRGTRE